MLATAKITETKAPAKDCVCCGEELPGSENAILCESCAETADLPLSSYYMTQYYYRFAD